MFQTIADQFGLDVEQVWTLLTSVALAIGIFIVGWIISKWAYSAAYRAAKRTNIDEAIARFAGSIAQYMVLIGALLASLEQVGVETTSFVAVLASAGFAVGMALQGNLANFASGVMILFFKPFQLGDKVDVNGVVADIEDIGLFATTLVTIENKKVIMSNSSITSGTIINITTKGQLRGSVDFGVAYGSNLDEVMAVALKAANSVDVVLKDPGPAVAFVEMAASSLNFQVHCWCDPADYLDMLHAVRCAVYNELNAAEIEIPFDQVVMHQAGPDA